MTTKIALRLTDEDYDHYVAALSLRYGAHHQPGALLRLAVKEVVDKANAEEVMNQSLHELLKAIDHNRSLSPLEKLNVHLAACLPLLEALQPASDADAGAGEWQSLRYAVERAVACASNIRTESKLDAKK